MFFSSFLPILYSNSVATLQISRPGRYIRMTLLFLAGRIKLQATLILEPTEFTRKSLVCKLEFRLYWLSADLMRLASHWAALIRLIFANPIRHIVAPY